MNQNPNPYEATNYGSNQPGGNNPNNPNNPYEQFEPTQRAEPYQQQQPPYAPPPSGQGSSGSYPPPQYPPQQPGAAPNPYSYPNPPSAPPPAYNQAGTYTPTPPPPTAPRRSSTGRILIIALVVLVVLAGIGAAIYIPLHNTQVANTNATATAQTNGTAIARTATALSQAHATATAQNIATATAVANTFPFSANVVLNDPLSDNSHGYKWKTDSNCTFTGGAYHAAESTNNTYYTCPATGTNFSNFTYQVTMQVNKGDIAGITFRGTEASSKNYSFIFSSKDGSYVLFLYTSSTNPRTLQSGTATQFNTGLGQKNDIGVVARGSSIDLYVNKQKLASTSDSTLSSGQIGTIVYDTGDAADVSFNNAMVWGL